MTKSSLHETIVSREARIGVVGLGYVGLPLVDAFWGERFDVTGFDIDHNKVDLLNQGGSYIRHIPESRIGEMVSSGRFRATCDFGVIDELDILIICVPTPLTRHREPDLSFVQATADTISAHLRRGQLVVLESTTYPGTTQDVLRPILERQGLKAGADFFLAFSPEREDPGNLNFKTKTIPKVVGADDEESGSLAALLYAQIVAHVVKVSCSKSAEAVKLTENIFRAVNVALVNELKLIFTEMGIDIWEVIEAAKTKPFGFMAFYPGPGLGGHCIPIDPFYLTWKAREYDVTTRFIELAGDVNTAMPRYVVQQLSKALDERQGCGLKAARILVLGVAYKKNVNDMRESPSLKFIDILQERGAQVDYYDPYIPEITPTREHPELEGMSSISWSPDTLRQYNAVVVMTDHDQVDYSELVRHSRLVIDTRNATKNVTHGRERIVKS